MKKLNEVYSLNYGLAVAVDGLFFGFMNSTWLPADLRSNPQSLTYIDEVYYGRSSEKYISSYLEKLISASESSWSFSRTRICSTLTAIYGKQWKRLFDIYSAEYDPKNNYDMTEEMTDDVTEHEYGKTSTRSFDDRDTQIQRTPNLSTVIDGDVFGFNSTSAVHADKSTTSETGTDTTHQTETGEEMLTDGGKDTDTHNYTLTRSGNIGVTTTQQMLESEDTLWGRLEVFENHIFPAVDNLLCLKIY